MKNTDVKLKKLPSFNLARCKRCGICGHFCPTEAIAFDEQGLPFLADPEACTSCNLCQDMCPTGRCVYLHRSLGKAATEPPDLVEGAQTDENE